MKFPCFARASLIFMGLVLVGFDSAVGQNMPPVKGIWILPDSFKNEDVDVTQKEFATAGKSFLQAYLKRVPNLNVKIVEGAAATRNNVLNTIRNTLESLKAPGSILVFYFGGHGIRPGRAPDSNSYLRRGSTYLALQGCEVVSGKDVSFSNMVMLEEIMSLQSQYEHVYFMGILDSCFSGNESFNAQQLFRSDLLGARGFLLCSSGGDRLTYDSKFSDVLTEIYDRDSDFQTIRSPSDLLAKIKEKREFPPEQLPRLIPSGSKMEAIYPLPGLCFCVINFGGYIKAVVNVQISNTTGRSITYSFNAPSDGQELRSLGSVAFPVQQLDGVKIVVNISSQQEEEIVLNLKGKSYAYKEIHIRGTQPNIAGLGGVDLEAVSSEMEKIVSRAKGFGLTDNDISGLGRTMLSARLSRIDPSQNEGFIAKQIDMVAAAAPTAIDVEQLRVLSGSAPVARGREGFVKLEEALGFGLPTIPSVAKAYANNVGKNILAQNTGEGEVWIEPKDIARKLSVAGKIAVSSGDKKALRLVDGLRKEAVSGPKAILKPSDNRSLKRFIDRELHR